MHEGKTKSAPKRLQIKRWKASIYLTLLIGVAGTPKPAWPALPLKYFNPATRFQTWAVNWGYLRRFLETYQQPTNHYQIGVFDCRDFARALIKKAHTEGLKAHLVVLVLKPKPDHAIVGFPTSDCGTIYVDTTPNGSWMPRHQPWILGLKVGKSPRFLPLNQTPTKNLPNVWQIATKKGWRMAPKLKAIINYPQRLKACG